MDNLLERNIFEYKDNLVVCGTCVKSMAPIAYKKFIDKFDLKEKDFGNFCLEKDHVNMAIPKIAAIIAENQVKKVYFISVDKSPHCVQLHYIRKELERIMDLSSVEIRNFVTLKDELIEISIDTISISKNLSALQNKS